MGVLLNLSYAAIAYSAMLRLTSSEPEEWKQVVTRSLAAAVFRVPSELSVGLFSMVLIPELTSIVH